MKKMSRKSQKVRKSRWYTLRIELVFFMMFSLFVSLALFLFMRDIGVRTIEGNEKERMKRVESAGVLPLEQDLVSWDFDDTRVLQKKLHDNYADMIGYTFCLTDKEGNLIAGTNRDIKTIEPKRVGDGLRGYAASEKDKNVFMAWGCDFIKEGYYLYFSYLNYDKDDTDAVVGALFCALLCFLFLIWGRISYISSIRVTVGEMTDGNLKKRIPIRYKNELGELAKDINHMAETLEKEEQSKNEFFTNISHDFRTPLTTLMGYLTMIKEEKYDSREELDTYLSIMERKGQFLSSMLEDFFQYAKLESTDYKIQFEQFELNELLRQFYEDEMLEFEEAGLLLELNLYGEPIWCKGDRELIIRAIGNFFSNAKKYAKRNTAVKIKTGIRKEEKNIFAIITIQNIPKEPITQEELSHFFDRLYKKDEARGGSGSGLGLSIAKNIMKVHGGNVDAYKEDEWVCFAIKIPLEAMPGKNNVEK